MTLQDWRVALNLKCQPRKKQIDLHSYFCLKRRLCKGIIQTGFCEPQFPWTSTHKVNWNVIRLDSVFLCPFRLRKKKTGLSFMGKKRWREMEGEIQNQRHKNNKSTDRNFDTDWGHVYTNVDIYYLLRFRFLFCTSCPRLLLSLMITL